MKRKKSISADDGCRHIRAVLCGLEDIHESDLQKAKAAGGRTERRESNVRTKEKTDGGKIT